MDVMTLAKQVEDYVIQIRRTIHQNPERPWEEWETTKLIEDELPPEATDINGLISHVLEPYVERAAGATKRLERACGIIIMTYYATLVRQKAHEMFAEVTNVR